MTIIEINPQSDELIQRRAWSHYLVLIFAALALLIGINLRASFLNATTAYINTQAGIRAFYPENWLIDSDGEYVFRVRDMAQRDFKTTIQVAVYAVSDQTTTRNAIDALNGSRSQTLAAYSVLGIEPYLLPDEITATSMGYTYVHSEANPFLQSVPVVVRGLDILTIERGQVIVMSFLCNAETFEATLSVFQQFLNDLEF